MNYYNKTIIHELAALSNDFLRGGMLLILLGIILDRRDGEFSRTHTDAQRRIGEKARSGIE